MIVHRIGQDTYVDFDWEIYNPGGTDDGTDIDVADDGVAFDVIDAAGDPVDNDLRSITVTQEDPYAIGVHIADDSDIDAGSYSYTARANDGTDWYILSAGLLRVK